MLLRFLGTSAGELYPGIWCRCRNCQQARTGGAEDRRQSAALYVEPETSPADGREEGRGKREEEDNRKSKIENRKLDSSFILHPSSFSNGEGRGGVSPSAGILIDFPSEIIDQAYRHQVELPELQYLLVTHSHGDHWFPYFLRWRRRPSRLYEPGEVAPIEVGGPRFTDLPTLHIWGNAAVEAVLKRELGDDLEPNAIKFHQIRPGDEFAAGPFSVTALPANHDVGREEAVHYVLQAGLQTLLYGLDGDTFLPQTRERLKSFRFDVVILEGTYGLGDGGNHRNFARVIEEAAWFRAQGLMAADGRIVATHFSPHHSPPHQETADYLRPHDIVAAWDGMEMKL